MGLYGTAGLLLASYLWLVILWDVGGGYNEFNQETGTFKIFRWGFPGKNRQIQIDSRIQDVQSVRIDIKEGLNPRRALYLRVKGSTRYSSNTSRSTFILSRIGNSRCRISPLFGSTFRRTLGDSGVWRG